MHGRRRRIKSKRNLKGVKGFKKLPVSVDAHLNLDDRCVTVGHGGSDGNSVAFMNQTEAFSFSPDKPFLCAVIHLLIKAVITLLIHVKDSHCKPVRVQVEVVRNGEHDGHLPLALLGTSVLEVVGEDSHRSSRCVGSLDEQSAAIFRGAQCRWGGPLTGSTVNEHTGDTKKGGVKEILCRTFQMDISPFMLHT